jgi:Mrp family chromosome partitioning ATPase
MRSLKDSKKIVIGLVGGGLVLGLALAMAIEFVFDRTIKRARELETRLRLPLMLTIPDFGGRLQLQLTNDDSDPSTAIAEPEGELLRPFCEAIRDRLGLFFELNNLAHKPKLVAVTGLSANAGVSTLAAGLADVLTEGGEGKVLLVNKTVNPKKFYSLMKEFKSSDVDYIVFDMPSLGDTSSTLPMAGFMDKVLLIVEAEKSNRDSVKRAYEQLSAKTDVSVIFNKSRTYGPKWLEGEL